MQGQNDFLQGDKMAILPDSNDQVVKDLTRLERIGKALNKCLMINKSCRNSFTYSWTWD